MHGPCKLQKFYKRSQMSKNYKIHSLFKPLNNPLEPSEIPFETVD
jgi:hypothetical protein